MSCFVSFFFVIQENAFEAYKPYSNIECHKDNNPHWHQIHSVAPKNQPEQRAPYKQENGLNYEVFSEPVSFCRMCCSINPDSKSNV